MEFVYFTAAGILLYVVSDWILNKIEQVRGERLPQRSVVFFLIILILSVIVFQAIQYFFTPPVHTSREKGSTIDIIRDNHSDTPHP